MSIPISAGHQYVWTPVERTVDLADPDAAPPPQLLATAFAEFWLDHDNEVEVTSEFILGIGIEAVPDDLALGLRCISRHPSRLQTQFTLEAHKPRRAGLVCCRITGRSTQLYRLDLLIPATNTIVGMCTSADQFTVFTSDDLERDLADETLTRQLLMLPNDDLFWVDIDDVDFGETFTGQ